MSRRVYKMLSSALKPEVIAAILISLFGVIFIGILRPLDTPDEANHFVRAYEVSEGKVFGVENGDSGCVTEGGGIFKGSTDTASAMPKSVARFTSLNWKDYDLSQQFKQRLNSHDQVNVCGRQTRANSPIGYLPQAVVMALLRPFNAPPIAMDYAARILILAVWAILISLAIKIIPVRKWAFVAVALLPISIQQSISIGADPLSIAPAALFTAILVRSYFEDRSKSTERDILHLTLLAAIAALSKPVMVLLVIGLIFYNSNDHQKLQIMKWSVSKRLLLKTIAICVPIILCLAWSFAAGHHGASAADVFHLAKEKSALFRSSPLGGLRLFVAQAFHYVFSGFSLDEFGSFGWFEYTIPLTWGFAGVAGLVVALLVGYEEKVAPLKQLTRWSIYRFNAAAIVTALGIVGANIFTLFVIWTPLNAAGVEGVQFRYFIPAFFVLASLIQVRFLRASERWYRNFVLISASILFLISALTIASGTS